MRAREAEMAQLIEKITVRLFGKRSLHDASGDDGGDEKRWKKTLHLPGMHHVSHEESDETLCILNENVYTACSHQMEELCHKDTTVLREGPVELELGRNKKVAKRWLVLYKTRLELKETAESRSCEKRILLFEMVPRRVPPQRTAQHLVELTTLKHQYCWNFESSDEADAWQHSILTTRLMCLTLLLDLVPSFRNLVFAKPQSNLSGGGSRKVSTDASGRLDASRDAFSSRSLPGGQDNLKFAFLEFQRVAMAYEIALSLHDTYVNDVEKQLARLDALAEERTQLRQSIASKEREIGFEERRAQAAGQNLSEAFSSVLESASLIHKSLTETHSELIMTQTLGLGLTEEQEDTIRCFRQTLDMLERGLAMDGPLKRQLVELEMREQEAMADVEELEARNQRLTMSLAGVRSKREILEEVMHSAGTLQGALGQGK